MGNLNRLQESHPWFNQLWTTHYNNMEVINSTITCEAMRVIVKKPNLTTRHNRLSNSSFCMSYSKAGMGAIYDYNNIIIIIVIIITIIIVL